MKKINDLYSSVSRDIKVLQFGEGNFLRAFVDYYIQQMNDMNSFNGNVAIVKSIVQGNIEKFDEQDNLYTVLLRGKRNNQIVEDASVINSIAKAVDLHSNYNDYKNLIELESVKFLISNTTEAGIVFNPCDKLEDNFNISYPAKLTQLLYTRFNKLGDKGGLYIIPCELIDDNASKLYQCVSKYIDLWQLPEEFKIWHDKYNYYCNSLVDRIVTGFPHNDKDSIFNKLGYIDELVTIGEPFGLWVIEKKGNIQEELKADGLAKVIFVSDVKDYKTRKVRLLNGAHTSMVPVAFLSGLDTVGHSMAHSTVSQFVKATLYNEIIPTTPLEYDELVEFADSVVERFENPFVNHLLLSIALNSISKWRVRVLPSLVDYYKKFNKIPVNIAISLAFLIKMYSSGELINNEMKCSLYGKNYSLYDDIDNLEFFNKNKGDNIVSLTLANVNMWGEDLTRYQELDELVNMIYNKLNVDTTNEVLSVLEDYYE